MLSFDSLPPAVAQACHEETLDWPPCQQHRSPMVGCKGHHLSVPWPWEISQPFGFPVRMMGADVSGTTSFQELFVQHFQSSSVLQGFRTLKHWSGSHRDQTSLFGSAAQPPCFSGSLGCQEDPAQLQGTEEDPLCYRVQSSTLETP